MFRSELYSHQQRGDLLNAFRAHMELKLQTELQKNLTNLGWQLFKAKLSTTYYE